MTRASQRDVQPGGVVLIRHRGQTLLHAAYGLSSSFDAIGVRSAEPIPATVDTLYDLASLSKLYTTTCVLRLVEDGRLALDEPVSNSLPEFGANGKAAVTLRQLLTHTSGLTDHVALWQLEPTPEARLRRVLKTPLRNPPGSVFRYSDLGLIALGHLVERVAGKPLDEVVADTITRPLRLDSTYYRPNPGLRQRIAPTEDESKIDRGMVWGEVHDENAWSLGGVAGHAGLFGTAEDVGRFAQVFLDGGSGGGVRLLRPETVAEMTRSQIEPLEFRGLGWELNADYYMGDLTSPSTFGHTGFTGTSLLVDPERELVVVLLSNRVHPTRTGPSQNPTRQGIANAALAAIDSPTTRSRVLPGIDVLMRDQRALLSGRRIGLITNATGRDFLGRSTIDVLHAESAWQLAALFSPEHGIRGQAAAGEAVQSTTDAQTGLPIHSLYGDTVRPTPAMLRGIDVLVYDIQDVGARTYTYIATLLEVLRAGAEHGKPVVVLDRPNPIGGEVVDGNVLDPRFTSFVGPAPLAMRYGLTVGELVRWFNARLDVGADLTVVPMAGWRRDVWFDQTGLEWVNPSPNLGSLDAATLYAGTVLFEGTNLSEGRGTDRPFEWIGGPGIDGAAWAQRLRAQQLAGVRFEPARRTPTTSKHAGLACDGVLVKITDRRQVRSMELGVSMLSAVLPQGVRITASTFDRLAGTDQLRLALQSGRDAHDIVKTWQPSLEAFRASCTEILLY